LQKGAANVDRIFRLGLNDIQIKMLVGAININRATSFAGFLIRKDL
jgi:hypothetical protein